MEIAARGIKLHVWLLLGLLCIGLLASLFALEQIGAAPREFARRVERPDDAPALLKALMNSLANQLRSVDGYALKPLSRLPDWVGAQAASAEETGGQFKSVSTEGAVLEAIAQAKPGDVIELASGNYRFAMPRISVAVPGELDLPITVRAAHLGDVRIEFDALEGFHIRAPFWRFENLEIVGVCPQADNCEHAFHVTGAAHNTLIRNNRIMDFNAHIKINGEAGSFPDNGRIEQNTLGNTAPRRTANPVTPIDLVAASGWRISKNLIHDFIKLGGNRISYGAFAKGGGSGNRFDANAILCEANLVGFGGQRVGLSLGGGGTDPKACRDGRCVLEQERGMLVNNLIARCSDRGIYLNSSATTTVSHNTVLNTSGVTVRFLESSARFDGNLIDGPIASRDGGIVHEEENRSGAVLGRFFGLHPVRSLFVDADSLDLAWQEGAPMREERGSPRSLDLCGRKVEAPYAMGAFADFSACLTPQQSVDLGGRN